MGYIHAFPKSAKQGKTSATMMLITGLDDGLTWSKYDAWFDPKRIHILKRNLYGEIMYTIDRESLDIDSPGGANYRCVLSSEDLVITKREEILNLQFDKNKI